MSADNLPACGLYRTTREVAGVPEGRLVYFHNHGDPGPGIYLPAGWKGNRAQWNPKGHTLAAPETDVSALEKVAAEGFYRVAEAFFCCDKECRRFEPDMLVQLGYNASAAPILFVPELADGLLGVPERGTILERDRIASLRLLKVAMAPKADAGASGTSGASSGPMLH